MTRTHSLPHQTRCSPHLHIYQCLTHSSVKRGLQVGGRGIKLPFPVCPRPWKSRKPALQTRSQIIPFPGLARDVRDTGCCSSTAIKSLLKNMPWRHSGIVSVFPATGHARDLPDPTARLPKYVVGNVDAQGQSRKSLNGRPVGRCLPT